MEAKDKLSKMIEALMELNTPVQKDYLLDYILGKDNEDMEEQGLTDQETYGILQGEEDALIEVILKEAVKKNLIDFDSDHNTYMWNAAGKKFQKKPKSFVVDYDDDDEEAEDATIDDSIDGLIGEIEADSPERKILTAGPVKKSSLKILLIHAIDNKKALDDFAESQGRDFDEILDELEAIINKGMKLDIDYFLQEIFTQENLDEVMEYFEEVDGDIHKAIQEFEDIYSPEELRLIHVKYITTKK